MVCARARDCVTGAREAGEALSIALGIGAGDLDRGIRQAIGRSPLSLDDVAAIGFDLDASAALFGQGGAATAVLPIRDAELVRGFLAERRPDEGSAVVVHRGHEVFTWPAVGFAWVIVDGWLLAHFGRGGDAPALDWLDRALAAGDGGGLGHDPDLAATYRRGSKALGGGTPGLLALVALDRLARDLAAIPDSRELGRCFERAATVAPRLHLAGQVSWDSADVWAALDLDSGAARALREHTGPAAPAGYYAYRRRAAISASLAVELPWLETLRAASGCPLLDMPIRDPVQGATGLAGPRVIHLAASDLDPDRLSGAGAVHLVLADRNLVQAQLESIPGRSLFERSREVAGRKVKVLSLPGVPAILHHQEGDRFTGTLGAEAMTAVLGPGSSADAAPGRLELASLALEPGRLPHLGQLLGTGLELAMGSGWADAGYQLARRLGRYQRAAIALSLSGDSVELRASMRLRK
jgi:hypothetical protein